MTLSSSPHRSSQERRVVLYSIGRYKTLLFDYTHSIAQYHIFVKGLADKRKEVGPQIRGRAQKWGGGQKSADCKQSADSTFS